MVKRERDSVYPTDKNRSQAINVYRKDLALRQFYVKFGI